jgi:hypothetical protein
MHVRVEHWLTGMGQAHEQQAQSGHQKAVVFHRGKTLL